MNSLYTNVVKTRPLVTLSQLFLAMVFCFFSAFVFAVQIQENATGFCSTVGNVESAYSGYTGAGYINTDDSGAAGIEYRVSVPSAGSYNITFRFSAADATGMKMRINGGSSFSFPFHNTSSYSDWDTTTSSVTLASGDNTIWLQNTGSSPRPLIDYMEVDGGASAVYCGYTTSSSSFNG